MTRRLISALLGAAAVLAMTTPGLAQTPVTSPAAGEPDVFGNMPGAVILLIPLAIGAALYLAYRLGRPEEAPQRQRREGPVSRALSQREQQGGPDA